MSVRSRRRWVVSEIHDKNSDSNSKNPKQNHAMNDAMKNWLPITVRNCVALGFAFAALVMFVVWNLLPYYELDYKGSDARYLKAGPVFMQIWPEVVNLDYYRHVIRSPDINGFLSLAASIALLLNGLIVLTLLPLWKILHVSNYFKLPVAVLNLLGGLIVSKFLLEGLIRDSDMIFDRRPNELLTFLLIALTMFAVSAAMVIFKNELGTRHELEVKKMMGQDFR